MTRLRARWESQSFAHHVRVVHQLGIVGIPFDALDKDQLRRLAKALGL